ncbi:DUF4396 domain-containing protein [Nocardioides korecus]
MNMQSRVPGWLTPIAWAYIAASIITATYLAYDIYLRRHRHRTVASELVWVTSALYLGPIAGVLYHRYGRTTGSSTGLPSDSQPIAIQGLPGGGASAVSHLIGVPLVIASGLTIAGINLWVMILTIAVLAAAFLFLYERTTGGSTHPGHTRSSVAAAGASVLTVLAFDIGMGGWMLLLHFNEYMPAATEGSFWFLMQIGIVLGLLSGYPAVKWLTRNQGAPAVV